MADLKGKFIIAFDTMMDGWSAVKGEDEKPVLYNSHQEAVKEIFDDALSLLENRTPEEMAEYHENITPEIIAKMKAVDASGDVAKMEEFLYDNPDCNDNNEFIVPAEEYIEGRKLMFTGNGLQVTGTPAEELFKNK